MINDKFTMPNEEGKLTDYDVILTFDLEETNKSYVIYTDNTKNEKGMLKLYASTYLIKNNIWTLEEIKTKQELQIIKIVMDAYYRGLKSNN